MDAMLFVLLFAIVFLIVGGAVGWTIEVVLFRWVEHRYGVKLRYVSVRSPGWTISGAKDKWQLWVISAIHVLGIVLALGAGIFAAFAVLLLALPLFR